MKVALVSSEVYPFSKTGGLADVSAALPEALARLHTEVRVISPLYPSCRKWLEHYGELPEQHKLTEYLWIGDHQRQVNFRTYVHHGVEIVFIENEWAFDRGALYLDHDGKDYADNVGRFALFCRAVLEYYLQSGFSPDVFHVNDWQSSLIPIYLKSNYNRPPLSNARTVLTIHNLGYQGLFPAEEIYSTGLGWDMFTADTLEYHGLLNLLKGGIVFADAVTTVSPTYAKEIQHHEMGMGLDGLIRHHRDKLSGILNGIDTEVWNPATDPAIADNFSADKPKGKAACRKELVNELGLKNDPEALLLGLVTRFDSQKGVDLVLETMTDLKKANVQLALLGSGDPQLEARAAELSTQMPGRIGLKLGYDEVLSHKIYAGCDALLMPSRYEPCGLNQMYAQRYGTIPIVRATGGLKDTVTNFTPRGLERGRASGFTFPQFSARSLAGAVRKAWKLYSEDRTTWSKLSRHVMTIDHSWDNSARAYNKLYKKLTKPAGAKPKSAEARG